MKSLSRYFGINCIIICCNFWVFWSKEVKIISKVGDKVTLNCSNNSLNTLTLLQWRMNGQTLLTSKPIEGNKTHMNENATKLNLKMLTSESQLYGLVIENAQKSHEGNYTCVTTSTGSGVSEEIWQLLITDTEDWHDSSSTEEAENSSKPPIVAVVAVSCACSLILILLFVLGCVWKRRAGNVNRPSATIRQQPREEIYENHLEIQRHKAPR